MGFIFDDEIPIPLKVLFIGLWLIIGIGIGVNIPNEVKQLANAICDERFGTEYKSFEYKDDAWGFTIKGVNCESPVRESEKYDGLIVKIGGN